MLDFFDQWLLHLEKVSFAKKTCDLTRAPLYWTNSFLRIAGSYLSFDIPKKFMIDAKNIDLFIFDLDGTLIDSLEDLVLSINQGLTDCGCDPANETALKEKLFYGTQNLLEDLVGKNPELIARVYKAISKEFHQNKFDRCLMFEGVVALLTNLSLTKKVALLTNRQEASTHAILKHHTLSHFFTPIVAGDTLEVRKPSPIPIQYICEKLDIAPSRSVMIGDSYVDIQAGKSAGTATIGVLNGFTTIDMVQGAKPDLVLSKIDDLQKHF